MAVIKTSCLFPASQRNGVEAITPETVHGAGAGFGSGQFIGKTNFFLYWLGFKDATLTVKIKIENVFVLALYMQCSTYPPLACYHNVDFHRFYTLHFTAVRAKSKVSQWHMRKIQSRARLLRQINEEIAVSFGRAVRLCIFLSFLELRLATSLYGAGPGPESSRYRQKTCSLISTIRLRQMA